MVVFPYHVFWFFRAQRDTPTAIIVDVALDQAHLDSEPIKESFVGQSRYLCIWRLQPLCCCLGGVRLCGSPPCPTNRR